MLIFKGPNGEFDGNMATAVLSEESILLMCPLPDDPENCTHCTLAMGKGTWADEEMRSLVFALTAKIATKNGCIYLAVVDDDSLDENKAIKPNTEITVCRIDDRKDMVKVRLKPDGSIEVLASRTRQEHNDIADWASKSHLN